MIARIAMEMKNRAIPYWVILQNTLCPDGAV